MQFSTSIAPLIGSYGDYLIKLGKSRNKKLSLIEKKVQRAQQVDFGFCL